MFVMERFRDKFVEESLYERIGCEYMVSSLFESIGFDGFSDE